MFKVGERVFDIRYGWGVVENKRDSEWFCIRVKFDTDYVFSYSKDGRYDEGTDRSLYHHDYTPTDSLKPTLDSGQAVESNVLSKREKFAGMAMQGILAGDLTTLLGSCITSESISSFAVQCANDLLKALNESKL